MLNPARKGILDTKDAINQVEDRLNIFKHTAYLYFRHFRSSDFVGQEAVSLNYCLMVTGPAYGNQRASSALQFAQALLACGHRLGTVFFYQEGVANANRLSAPAGDEVDLVRAWHDLAQQHRMVLHVCVAAALRRGVTDALQASLQNRAGENLQPGFELSGLGTLARAVLGCDRFIQF